MKPSRLFTTAIIAVASLAAAHSAAAWTVAQSFALAGYDIIPLLEKTDRLDMIDYYNSGMEVPTDNLLAGKSRITGMDDMSMRIAMTPASDYQLALLPCGADTLVAVINTVRTPGADSRMKVYSRELDKELTQSTFAEPQIKDWLTAQGRKNAADFEQLVPFILVSYDYDPATLTLTLTNNSGTYLPKETLEKARPYMLDTLKYRWNGKKFVKAK